MFPLKKIARKELNHMFAAQGYNETPEIRLSTLCKVFDSVNLAWWVFQKPNAISEFCRINKTFIFVENRYFLWTNVFDILACRINAVGGGLLSTIYKA